MTAPEAGELTLLAEERDALVDTLVATQDRLSAVVAMLKVPSDTLDLDELTQQMLAEALELTESDVVMLSCAHGRPNQRASRDDDVQHLELAVELGRCLERRRPGSGQTGGLPWAYTAFSTAPSAGIAIGRLRGPVFSTGDVRMLHVVAVAVEQLSRLSRLHLEVVRQTAVEKEHQLASRLAQAVLPSSHPQVPGLDFFARCRPAALTGGDFMVFTEVEDAFWFAVGDVAGKGLPAAMIMTQAVAAVRAAMRTGDPDDPAGAVQAAGRDLQVYLDSVESFLTLAVAVHRRGRGTVALSNAGHSPVVYWAGPGEEPRSIGPSVPPLGVAVSRPPGTVVLPLPPGARLVIGTDGLVEQPDPQDQMLGYDAFLGSCASEGGSAAALGERLMAQVEAHAAGTPAADDRTLVVLQAAPTSTTGVLLDELTLDADLAELRSLGPWLGRVLDAAGASAAHGPLELALHEICVNVVTHAYANGPGRIRVRSRCDPQTVELEVRDDGQTAFDPSSTSEPVAGEPQVHGYGLMIVRQLVDELSYTYEEGTNVWLLRTRR